ncbi:Odorant receptor 355 [Nylanderia fulva]|uniref:Odorant receptor n=1 Tax=Nylanderia fulva TaxID=613905 RepID=A0A6G1LPD6_9HYME|nr:Odorant receptor 357 [Nylanderia fulva]KAF3054261.1 Odorant receptor 356 [Nylanderia fulva]KAF3054488.1 Odorant receptor 355 [Nylanderia fulva]
MAEGKDILQSRYYTIPRFYMTLAGLWPYHSIRDRYLHFVPTFTVCFIIFIPQVLYVHIALTDLDDLFECIPTMLITIIFSFKLASLMANSKKIKTCLKTVQDDWLLLSTDNEKAILQRQAAYGRYLTIFYAGLMLLTGFLYIIKSVVLILIEDSSNSTKLAVTKLPFRVEYGQKIDQYFYLILVHNYLIVCSHVTATVATDTLYFTLIQHACGMFSVVGDVNYNKVLECLRKHLHVIEFAEMIESTFANIFLVSISLNMVGGSICGIQVCIIFFIFHYENSPLAIYIAQLTHLFLQFWQAQFLLDYSVLPYESICKANWYYTSMRCRKLLLLIMNRTVLPCRITAGKVVTLSIESFGVVLKTSMSYFTMLRSFH